MAVDNSINSKSVLNNPLTFKFLLVCVLLIGLLLTGYLVFHFNAKLVVLGFAVIILILCSIKWSEASTLAVMFVLYINIAAVAKEFHGVSGLVAGSFSLLLVLPLAKYLFFEREKLVIDYVVILMLIFLAILFASSLFAKDTNRAMAWIGNYVVEGMAIYFLIINVIRNTKILKRVIWTLILACTLLGGLSVFQDVTRTYSNNYFGLAQRKIETDDVDDDSIYGGSKLIRKRDKVGGTDRAGGPLEGSNRYAQIMLVVLPFAVFRYWGERSRALKIFALIAAMLILSGIFLTYSRGAFVTLVMMLLIMTILRYIRIHQVIVIVLVILVIMIIAAPGYFLRVETLLGIEGLFSQSSGHRPDAVTRGRFTEMLAAFKAFLDYPILGVGPGQYTPFYSMEYQLDPDIAYRFLPKGRRAHTLYFEMMAETGILGFGTFMTIVVLVMYRLWRLRIYFHERNPEIANIISTLWFGIIAYLGTAVFLHLSYQRYYWIIMALSGAAIQIFQNEMNNDKRKEAEHSILNTQANNLQLKENAI